MSKPTTSQAFLYLLLTIFGLYLVSSLFSFSFSMSEWNAFSNIVFWGASIILTVWTFNDYIINTKPKNPNETYIGKQNQQEKKNEGIKLSESKNIVYNNTTETSATKKEQTSEFHKESEALKRFRETAERIKSNIAEIQRLDKEIAESGYKFERVCDKYEVQIGKQIWTAKNLDLDEFRNGDKITQARTTEEWIECLQNKKPAFCYYGNNKKFSYGYGKLYNYYAITDQRGLAPEGWSIPTAKDWLELKKCIKESDYTCTIGEALKSVNQVNSFFGEEEALDEHPRWDESMDNFGQDLYGFQAFPGGFRGADDDASFSDLGKAGYWWTTTQDDSEGVDTIILGILSVFSPHLHLDGYSERVGASVRLVKYGTIKQDENEEFETDNDLPF